MKPRFLFPLLLLLTGLRLAWVLTHEVTADDAYYWICSQRLAGAFFDGPAGTALVVRAFGDSLESARLFWPVLGFFCSATAWLFVRRLFDAEVAGWSVVVLNMLPIFNLAAVQVGPLMPAMVSVFAGLVFARVAWERRPLAWAGAAIFFGIATGFRYEAVLVPLGIILAGLGSVRHRDVGDLIGYACIVAVCGLALSPALLWNASIEWIAIAGGTWKSAFQIRPGPFLTSTWAVGAALSVPAALVGLEAFGFLLREARRHGREAFALAACGVAWAWTLYILLRGGDGISAAAMGTLPLCAYSVVWLRKSGHGGWVAVLVFVGAVVTTGFALREQSRTSWKAVAAELREATRDLPASDGGGFFIAEDTSLAAALGYHLWVPGKYPPVFAVESPALENQFALWPSYADFEKSDKPANEFFKEQIGVNPFVGRNAIFIGRELPQAISAAFQEVSPLRKVADGSGEDLTIYLCIDYETLPL